MSKNDNKIESYCKNIYKRCIALLTAVKVPSESVEKILSSDNYELALANFADLLSNKKYIEPIAKIISGNGDYNLNSLNHIFDTMWFYRRNLHFLVESVPNVGITDTRIFDEIGRDLCIDVNINGKNFGVYAFKRTYPIDTRRSQLNWTLQVYATTPSLLSENKLNVAKTAINPAYTIHFESSAETRKVYIEHNEGYVSDCSKLCASCKKCNNIEATYAGIINTMRLYSLKYRDDNDCKFYTTGKLITPADVLKCIIHALECYKAREVITRKNGRKAGAYKQCKVHIASSETYATDKIVMLPLHEYVKEYRESHPQEYKGGHHASPVAHMRRGYYRKARKHGDYVKKGDKFTYVGNGEGNYCFVRATQVNNKTDRVLVYQTPKNS